MRKAKAIIAISIACGLLLESISLTVQAEEVSMSTQIDNTVENEGNDTLSIQDALDSEEATNTMEENEEEISSNKQYTSKEQEFDVAQPERENEKEQQITFKAIIDDVEIKPCESNGKYYFMLPNGLASNVVAVSYSGKIVTTSTGELDPSRSVITLTAENEKEMTVTDEMGNRYTIIFMQSTIPSLSISLNGCSLETINAGSKDTKYEGNHVGLTGTNGMDLSADNVEIKGRGNSSWSLDKKPYQIKFDKKTNVLGMGKAKKWVLLASQDDASFVRNKIVFDMANDMGMEGSPQCEYVDLWIDGEYLGLYLISQKIDINSSSVDLKNEDGVLVELDNVYYQSEDCWYGSDLSNSHFVLKEYNSDDDGVGKKGFNIFCDTINEFERYLYSQEKNWEKISSYIDAESFAKYYLIQEFTENWDAMAGSTYMYQDGGEDVIHLGPVWDLGLSLGNQKYQDVNSKWVTNNPYQTAKNTWFEQLIQIPEFCELVQKIYQEQVDSVFRGANDEIATIAENINASANMNFTVWEILGKENQIWVGMPYGSSFSENINVVKKWISDRNSYMQQTYSGAHVLYSTHVQSYGWQGYVSDGTSGGTTGESKRLEAIRVQLTGVNSSEGGIQYRTHIQTYGWEKDWKSDGSISGTSGESKRLEAIQIKLTGKLAESYDVYYRVHAQTYGWLGWAKNEEVAGTQGLSKRLESIEIRLVKKGDSAPDNYLCSSVGVNNKISYSTHVQTYGWQGNKYDGLISGTSGESKRLEAIKISLVDKTVSGGVRYKTHVQTYGWQSWVSDGQLSGTSGESKRLEAIQIELTGQATEKYDIYYRVHAQTYGWLGWAKNGEAAGTEGLSKRLEAIQIVLVEKGGAAPGNTNGALIK